MNALITTNEAVSLQEYYTVLDIYKFGKIADNIYKFCVRKYNYDLEFGYLVAITSIFKAGIIQGKREERIKLHNQDNKGGVCA